MFATIDEAQFKGTKKYVILKSLLDPQTTYLLESRRKSQLRSASEVVFAPSWYTGETAAFEVTITSSLLSETI